MDNMLKEYAGKQWTDWHWQQRNSISGVESVKKYFTQITLKYLDKLFTPSQDRIKFQVTPYMLSQIPQAISQEQLERNPWFLQFFPQGELYKEGHDAYDGTDNWESREEFPTSNIHHKYTNRALVRFRNCLAYCNYCFESMGILEKNPAPEKLFQRAEWQSSLDYIAHHSEIEEVILSGGEPLLLSDSKLDKVLKDIDGIQDESGKKKVRFKRIHTRVLTHNPYRVTEDLVSLLARYQVNEVAFHVTHPDEITPEFIDAVGKVREFGGRHAPLLAAQTPLVAGINDNANILWELFARLFENNIKPYYLLHTMPHTPFANQQRVSVRDGVCLMKQLKRHKSNIAIPEYVIVHYDGKQTVPLELEGTPEFQYTRDSRGNPIVRFKNWRCNWMEYPDAS